MSKNIILSHATEELIVAIENLKEELELNIEKWFFSELSYSEEFKESLNFYEYRYIPDSIYKSIYPHLPLLFDFYDREQFTLNKEHHEIVNIFNMNLQYIYNILTRKKIDVVFFTSDIPHSSLDYLLYLVAKELKIKVVCMYSMPLFADRFFPVYDIEDFGRFELNHSKELVIYNIDDEFIHKPESVMKKNIKRNSCFLTLVVRILRYIMFSKNRFKNGISSIFKTYSKCKSYRGSLSMLVSEVDLSKKFVFFALHLQPELHTSTLGKEYNDQILALEKISKLIPSDWFIYVKENPNQMEFQRDELFFERMRKIPNLKLVSPLTDVKELILKSQFVSTITGTIGWEAIRVNKKVLLFGKSWYLSLPGVFNYTENLILKDIMNFNILRMELESKYNKLMRKSRNGTPHKGFKKYVKDYNESENIKKLVNFFKEEILDRNSDEG